MTIQELKEHVLLTIDNLKNHGIFPKENNIYDYKSELNIYGLTDHVEIFSKNFVKDILSFSNGNGGIILLGIKENKATGILEDIGLDQKNIELLSRIDINIISQKFEKIAKVGVGIDLQQFQSGTRKYYYLLIEKQNQILIPSADYPEYKLSKGEIIYRASSKNETANHTTQEFNRFLQIKANEKNKEFMEIWSKLLPEIFDINPKEILIINPKYNKVYGFNSKDNILASSEIEIDKSDKNGVFNIILNAISAGEIGKITNDEGKPLYKIVGEITTNRHRPSITMTTLQQEILKISNFKFTNLHLKTLIYKQGWTTKENFRIENPSDNTVNETYNTLIWIDTFDEIKATRKIVFATNTIEILSNIINDNSKHIEIFKKVLDKK
ncbi:MAG: ATP-binding protein [Bacteroidales bacterium]|nr:ATP-binding protein [Bacteroidales bacterium]